MEFIRESDRIVLKDGSREIGEITWSAAGENMIIVDHTFVDDCYRGRHLANQLVAQVVGYARENKKKIFPLCPFAKAEIERTPEYHDILKS